MTSTTWTAGNGDFNTAANWSAGVPTAGVDGIINGSSITPLTVTFAAGTDTANSLSTSFATLSMSGGSLTLQNTSNMSGGFTESAGLLDFQNGGNNTVVSTIGPVSQTGGALEVDAGRLDVRGNSSFAAKLSGSGDIALRGGFNYALNAGTTLSTANLEVDDGGTALTVGANLTYAGHLYEDPGATINLGSHTLTLSGSSELHALITGTTGKLTSSGSMVAAGMTVGGSMTLQNTKTLATASGFTLGDTAASTAQLINSAGAIINLTGDGAINANGNVSITNTGTLEKTAGAGTVIWAPVTSTGTVLANSGYIDFHGNNTTFSGAINGTGAVYLSNNDTFNLNSGASLGVALFSVGDSGQSAALNVNISLSDTHVFDETNGSTINLGANTLTLSGNDALNGLITGTGRVVSSGNSTADNMTVGGAATFENQGTLSAAGGFTVGNSASSTAQLVNDAGAIIDLTGDGSINANGTVSITNAGTLEKTAATGNVIWAPVTSTGTVLVNSGYIDFHGNNSTFSGAINGSGSVYLGNGGTFSFNSGVSLGVALFSVGDGGAPAALNLNTSVSDSHVFDETNGSIINVGANTLTLSGNDALNGLITGTGRVVTSGTSTVDNMTLGSSVTFENQGTVSAANGFTVGNNPSSTAQLLNDAGAVINFTADGSINANGVVSISNAGTLEKTAGAGTVIWAPVTSTGTVLVNSGYMDFHGNNSSFSGPITGSGAVYFGNNGTFSLNAGATLGVGLFNVGDGGAPAALNLNTSPSDSQAFNENNGSTINLGANTLTLSGTDSLNGLITGTGRVVSSGHVTADNMTLGGAATFENQGTVSAANGFTLGNNASSTAQILNDAGAVINLTGDGAINANGTVSITNAGMFEKTAGTGNSVIWAPVISSGTVLVNSGTVDFHGNNTTFSGAVNGTGTVWLSGYSTFNLNAGASIGVATLSVGDPGQTATLNVNTSLSDANTLDETSGSTINLGANTLTLNGSASLNGLVTGTTGKLVFNNASQLLTTDNLTLGGKVVLQDKGLAGQAGNMTVGDNAASTAKLQILTGASYSLTADNTILVNGSASISNGGTFGKTAGTGTSVVDPTFINTGKVTDNTGRLDFASVFKNDASATVTNGGSLEFGTSLTADTGKTGTVTISDGGTARFDGFVSTNQTANFTDNTGNMVLASPGNFDAAISGFQGTVSQSDTIEIVGLTGLTDSYSGTTTSGVLTLMQGATTVAQLHFNGNYSLSNFTLSTSGGNTIITDPPSGLSTSGPALAQLAVGAGVHSDLTNVGGLFGTDPTGGHSLHPPGSAAHGGGLSMPQARVDVPGVFAHHST